MELALLAEERARRTVTALTDGAAALSARIRGAQGTRAILAAAMSALGSLRDYLRMLFAEGEHQAQDLAVAHLRSILELMAPVEHVSPALAQKIAELRDLELTAVTVDRLVTQVADEVQRAIVVTVARGQAPDVAAEQAVTKNAARAATTARTEASRAYNDAALAGIRQMNADDPGAEPYLKRIEEILDERNHPFSRVADGQTQSVDDPFRVSVAAVKAMAAELLKSAGGVFWPDEGGFYVGMSLPAHFNERGRVIPWRASWGT